MSLQDPTTERLAAVDGVLHYLKPTTDKRDAIRWEDLSTTRCCYPNEGRDQNVLDFLSVN
jgi:hypothetical protein